MTKRVFPQFTEEQEKELTEKIEKYKGSGPALGSALGALVVGQHYGWRVLKIIHTPGTYRKYEKILGISFKDFVPEKTEFSHKNKGYLIATKMKSFWGVVTGKIKVEDKGLISDEPQKEDESEK